MKRSSKSSAHKKLLKLQQRIFRSLEAEAADLFESLPLSIRRYNRSFQSYFRRVSSIVEPVEKETLVKSVQDSEVTLIGDFHTFPQAQRTALRLIREVILETSDNKTEWFIGLEMIASRYQDLLDRFQSGRLGLEEFHRGIKYEESWGFPWENYAPIFDWAKERNSDRKNGQIRLIALNKPNSDLHSRDKWAAEIITDLISRRRGKTKVIVLYGELHLAARHLPARIEESASHRGMEDLKTLSIHQNHDRLYWRIAEAGRELKAQLLRLGDSSYCVLSGTPWAKLQSMLSWAEGDMGKQDETDYLSLMKTYGETIAEFLRLPAPSWENLAIRTIEQADFVHLLKNDPHLKGNQLNLVRDLVQNNQRVYIQRPIESIAYLASPSHNATAELAAIHLMKQQSKRIHPFFSADVDDFFRMTLESAFGFFGSLVLNPRRKCDLPGDHYERIDALRGRKRPHRSLIHELRARQIAVAALQATSPKSLSDLSALRSCLNQEDLHPAALAAAKYLGRILGKRIHQAVLEGSAQLELLRDIARTQDKFRETFAELSRTVARVDSDDFKTEVI